MQIFSGIAASPGIAMGRLCIIDRHHTVVSEYPIPSDAVSHEIARLARAIEDTRLELESLKSHLAETNGEDHLFFIETHLMILADERLVSEASEIIRTGLFNAAPAAGLAPAALGVAAPAAVAPNSCSCCVRACSIIMSLR